MVKINLKEYYPEIYKENTFTEVSEEVAEFLESERPKQASEIRKRYRHNAQYSLDADDGIEEETLVHLFEKARENERLKERLEQAMKSLTDKQKRRFLMKYDLHMTYEEIAKDEDVAVNAVEDSVRQALTKLKKYFC